MSKRKIFLLLGDLAIILFSFNVALLLRLGDTLSDSLGIQKLALLVALILAYSGSFYIFDFYNIKNKFRSSNFLASLGGAFVLAYLFGILIFYVFPYKLGRGVFLISWVLTGILVFGLRLIYSSLFGLSKLRRNVLILGNSSKTEAILESINENAEYRLTAILDTEKVYGVLSQHAGSGGEGAFDEVVKQYKIDDIVVSNEAENSNELEKTLVRCRMKGIRCHSVESFYERILEKLPVLMLNDRWFLMSDGFNKLGSRLYKFLKRAFDLLVSALILLFSLPLIIIISLLIPLTSKGPIFFTQERLGARKKPFRIIKFRTMVQNAEANGPQWAHYDDERVTAIGKLLRRTRIDELPQFINVFLGDMSLIGPRPERAFFVDRLSERIPFYSLRFFVKPGITGWAQVNFRYGSDENDALEKLRYELFYIKNQSFFLDFRILLKTVRVVLTGLGT